MVTTEMKGQDSNNMYADGRYLNEHPNWHAEDSAWKAGQVLKMLSANQLTPSRVCEVGCGAGEILHQLYLRMPNNVNFEGFDVSPQAIDLCQPKVKERLRFYQEDFTSHGDTKYDLLLAMDVIEHVEDYMGFLRSLKPRAYYQVFHFPLDLSISSILRVSPILQTREREGHLHYFIKDTVLASLRDCGYIVLDVYYTFAGLELPSNGMFSRIMAVIRRIAFSINQDLAARVLGGFGLMVLTRQRIVDE